MFSEEIDIEDTMTLAVKCAGGVQMSYSLPIGAAARRLIETREKVRISDLVRL